MKVMLIRFRKKKYRRRSDGFAKTRFMPTLKKLGKGLLQSAADIASEFAEKLSAMARK